MDPTENLVEQLELEGEAGLTIGVNARYLCEALQSIRGACTICLGSDLDPIVIDAYDDSVRCVVMPMRR